MARQKHPITSVFQNASLMGRTAMFLSLETNFAPSNQIWEAVHFRFRTVHSVHMSVFHPCMIVQLCSTSSAFEHP